MNILFTQFQRPLYKLSFDLQYMPAFARARIFKLLSSPGIDSEEPIPPIPRAGTITLFLLGS
jgi:hypothetical protein